MCFVNKRKIIKKKKKKNSLSSNSGKLSAIVSTTRQSRFFRCHGNCDVLHVGIPS